MNDMLAELADKRDAGVSERATASDIPAPLGLLAELTHRCPLACPYCSNPLTLEIARRGTGHRDLGARFPRGRRARRASGPSLRRRTRIAARSCRDRRRSADAGLYTNLITSAIGLDDARVAAAEERRARSRAALDPGQRSGIRGPHRRLSRGASRASSRWRTVVGPAWR